VNIWPNRRIVDLLGIPTPILLAPMAGPGTAELAMAVSDAGGLGSLPCAQLSADQVQATLERIQRPSPRPLNLNFFCHTTPPADAAREARWRARLAPYYRELGLDPEGASPAGARRPFDEETCRLVEEWRPRVVSFHFGLPPPALLARVRATGARLISSATTVREARWLAAQGCDAIIAMGFEAGGHRGNFQSMDEARQVGTLALVPQVVDAVSVPVIAAGGIADARGIAAAFALGASAVQIGTAYLFCPEAKLPAVHRAALEQAEDDSTAVTNVFTGRPARGIVNRLMREQGFLDPDLPPFPRAAAALAPLRARSELQGSPDFTNLWAGQASRLAHRGLAAGDLTRALAAETLEKLAALHVLAPQQA